MVNAKSCDVRLDVGYAHALADEVVAGLEGLVPRTEAAREFLAEVVRGLRESRQHIYDAAREWAGRYWAEDDLMVFDDAIVREADGGYWVEAWVWEQGFGPYD